MPLHVGDIAIHPIIDGTALIPISEPFLNMPVEAWAPHKQFLTANDELELGLGGFFFRSGNHNVLVDCGVGPRDTGMFPGGKFLTNLAAIGVQPEDVTDVFFTHLHFDHVGWATQQGRIVFPNATYRCDERDWTHFTETDPGARKKLMPLADRLELWNANGTVLPGIDLMVAPGHTPGSTIIVVSSGTARAMLLGDVIHCAIEISDDEWRGMGDLDPDLALRTRVALLRELEGSDVPVAPAHFPGLQFGKVLTGTGKRQWVVTK